MNKYLKEALLKQQFKTKYKKVVGQTYQKDVLKEESLYKAFVEPFTDVLQAANLAGQDFLNSYLTYLRMFITWDKEKGAEILKKHDERKAKIAEKWKPLMEKTDDALSSGDADVLALVLAPQVFAVSAVGSKAAEYSGGMASFLNNVGLGGMVKAIIPDFEVVSTYTPDSSTDKDSSILDKMGVLFLGAVAAKSFLDGLKNKTSKNESLLKEDAGQPDFAEDLKQFFENSEASNLFKKDGDVLVKALETTIKEFDIEYQQRKELLENLSKAENLETFTKALTAANDLQESVDRMSMKKDLDQAVESLIEKEEFKEQVKEETGQDEVSSEDLKKAAQKVVFLDAKKSLETEVGGFRDGLQKYATSMGNQIKTLLPSESAMKILKKSKTSSEIINLIEKTKQKYFIA